MHMQQFIVCASILSILPGCASIDVTRVTSREQPGIRYWRPAPYIALSQSSDNKGTCEAKLVMLPDKSEEYAITMSAGIGTAEADPTLQDGWNLTGLTGKADSKTAENVGAFANLVSSIGNLAGGAAKNEQRFANKPKIVKTTTAVSQCRGLIRLEYDNETGALRRFVPMNVPVSFTWKNDISNTGKEKKE